jgi:hypothetical protein
LNYDFTTEATTQQSADTETPTQPIEDEEPIAPENEEPVDNTNATATTAAEVSPSPSTSSQSRLEDTTRVIVEPVSNIIEVAPAPAPAEASDK